MIALRSAGLAFVLGLAAAAVFVLPIEVVATFAATLLVASGLTILSVEGWCLLHRFRWFRRLRGGHWERHWVHDPVNRQLWLDVEDCSKDRERAYRTTIEQLRGTEDYYRHLGKLTRPGLTSGPYICEEHGPGFSLIARRAD